MNEMIQTHVSHSKIKFNRKRIKDQPSLFDLFLFTTLIILAFSQTLSLRVIKTMYGRGRLGVVSVCVVTQIIH